MRAYSEDLRIRVINCYQDINSCRRVGKLFNVGSCTVSRWLTNGISRVQRKSRDRKIDLDSKWITIVLNREPWLSLKEIALKIEEKFKIKLSRSTVSRYLKKLNITYKKIRKTTNTNANTKEIKDVFKKDVKQIGIDKILSFDEVGFQIEMFPRKGWSKKGDRCIYQNMKKGHENWTGSFLISINGIVKWDLSKESMNKEKLETFFTDLPNIVNGKTLVLDNLRAHHNCDVINKIKSNGIKEKFIPPYSPELNPVEEVFSFLKRELRKRIIRTGTELKKAMSDLVTSLNGKNLLKYFEHSYG